MRYLNNNFIFSPGAGNEGGDSNPASNEDKKPSEGERLENKEKEKDHKTLIQKIRAVLQDWSNKNDADTRYDDTKV